MMRLSILSCNDFSRGVDIQFISIQWYYIVRNTSMYTNCTTTFLRSFKGIFHGFCKVFQWFYTFQWLWNDNNIGNLTDCTTTLIIITPLHDYFTSIIIHALVQCKNIDTIFTIGLRSFMKGASLQIYSKLVILPFVD